MSRDATCARTVVATVRMATYSATIVPRDRVDAARKPRIGMKIMYTTVPIASWTK